MNTILKKPFIIRTREYIAANKIKSILGAIVILVIIFYTYKHFTATTGETTYVTGTATKDTIVASITESGQVETDHELDLKPQASANVVYVAHAAGDKVSSGDLIVELDTTDAEKAVRDAQANLQSAQLSLEKIQEPANNTTVLQAQNSLAQAKLSLSNSYDNGFSSIANAFNDLPNVINGLNGVLYNSDVNTTTNQQENIDFYGNAAGELENSTNLGEAAQFKSDAATSFTAAQTAYNTNFADFKNVSRNSDPATIKNLLTETYNTSVLISNAIKSANNLIQYYQNNVTAANKVPVPKSTAQLNTLSGYTNTVNTDVSSLSNSQTTIDTDELAVPEQAASLAQVQSGADALDVQSAQLSVTKAQNALQDAKDNLANYYVRAPFSGTLSAVDVKVGDPASSGSAVASLIADDEEATVTINEVDAAKIKLGDRATLTFDAIDGLTLTGKVATIDTVGTVTQGVVNYTATISFDSTDPRVKPGMSVSAAIITATAQDVLTVPNSALKTSANGSYVLVFDPALTGTPTAGETGLPSATPPKQVPVEVGLADDTNTEITSGLTEGEQIVTRTVAPSTGTTASSAPSLLSSTTGGRTAGAARGGAGAFGR